MEEFMGLDNCRSCKGIGHIKGTNSPLFSVIAEKLATNAEKYPVDKARGVKDKYDEL